MGSMTAAMSWKTDGGQQPERILSMHLNFSREHILCPPDFRSGGIHCTRDMKIVISAGEETLAEEAFTLGADDSDLQVNKAFELKEELQSYRDGQ